MASNYFIAGVCDASIFEGDQLICATKTLINNALEIQLQQQEIRGGRQGALLAMYSHSPKIDLTIEDALFDLNYIRMATGGKVKLGTDFLTCEVVQCTKDGEIEVSDTPVKFYNRVLILGWLEDNTVIEFEGKIARDARFKNGEYYLIKYFHNVPLAKELKIPSSIIPSVVTIILDTDLFFTETGDYKDGKKLGKMQIEVPRCQLDGNTSINMSMTGYTTTPIKGTALLYNDKSGCNDGYYVKISEQILLEVYRTLGELDELTLAELDEMTMKNIDIKVIGETQFKKDLELKNPSINETYHLVKRGN